MKRFFLFLMFTSLIAGLYATPSNKYQLVVRTTSGDTAFVLSQQPEISFTDKDVVVSNTETTITIPKTEFIEFLFTPSQYEINFYDWDGTLLQSSMVNYGEWPTYYNSDPWREADAQYTYTFTGWNPQLDWVTSNQSYYAQYEATAITTAIENTQSNEVKTYKILRDNKIFIIRGDKVYSILGHVIEDWMPLGL